MNSGSGVFTSRFLDTDYLKMALRARNVSGAFEKRARRSKQALYLELFALGVNVIRLIKLIR